MFNLKDLDLKELVKIGVAITATLMVMFSLNLVFTINNTTIINNYVKENQKNVEEIKADIAETNATVLKVQENVTRIKTDQNKELALQTQILREVD